MVLERFTLKIVLLIENIYKTANCADIANFIFILERLNVGKASFEVRN